MSRGRKLLMAGLVLAVGFGLAWPFRKTAEDQALESVAKSPVVDWNPAKIAATQQPTGQTLQRGSSQLGSPAPHVVAKMTSMGEAEIAGRNSTPTASFDLANHPALATPLAPTTKSPVTAPVPPDNQAQTGAYLPAQVQRLPAQPQKNQTQKTLTQQGPVPSQPFGVREQRPAEVRHVVQNSDTLEKLAKRYLGDEGRALEIFDLNRDVLDNPHLLPINAQLRIPRGIHDRASKFAD